MKKRLIGVINVKNGLAVQSFGYKKYLPIGNPKILVKNLDRWGADEILINAIDRSLLKLGPDYELIKQINSLKISTPIIYGGGIENLEDAKKVIASGADRILIETLINRNLNEFIKISNVIGSQSIIISLPIKSDEKKNVLFFDSISKKVVKMSKNMMEVINNKLVSEILLIDYINEGYLDQFNLNILNLAKKFKVPVICFGGISKKNLINKIVKNNNVNAVAIGNSLNYKEISIQNLKKNLFPSGFRKPVFIDKI